MKVKATTIQTLIFDKRVFTTEAQVRRWVREHGFSIMKTTPVLKPGIDETSTSWRVRQRNPGDFVRGSFRTITITEGVKAVVGTLKKARKAEHDLIDLFLDTLDTIEE